MIELGTAIMKSLREIVIELISWVRKKKDAS